MATRTDVAIIGAGLSGSLVAIQLLLQARSPLRITLIERGLPFGRGLAYSTTCPDHRLNVPAGRMSAIPGDSGHFLLWAKEHGLAATAHDFLQRNLYGDYVNWLMDEATRRAEGTARLDRRKAEVTEISRGPGGELVLGFRKGAPLVASRVVLALGNFQPTDPRALDVSLEDDPRYVRNPWAPGALEGLDPMVPVLMVGTGLTLVDVALALRDLGHRGDMMALSRHGLLPERHAPTHPVVDLELELDEAPETAHGLFSLVTREVARHDGNWRGVMDALRPDTAGLWQRLPLDERRRFLRHLRTYWEVHRHRMAPEVAEAVDRLRSEGQLQLRAARLVRIAPEGDGVEVVFRPRGFDEAERVRVARVVNCTGPNLDLRRERDLLLSRLRARGWIVPDPLGLGLSSGPDGGVLDAAGRTSRHVFTLGPLRRGDLWETTAAPEIGDQAERLAARILADVELTPARDRQPPGFGA